MAYSAQSLIGGQIISQLGVGTDQTQLQGNQDHLGWYLDALGALFQEGAAIVLDQGVDGEFDDDGNLVFQSGYGVVFTINPRFVGDTAVCPTALLPYIAQYLGIQIPSTADDATARALLTGEANLHRGGPDAIVAAAQRWLTGSQAAQLIERTRPDGSHSGYWFLLHVLTSEVVDQAALVDAVNSVKPGGIMWQLVINTGTAWAGDSRTFAANSTTWAAN